MSYRPNLEKGDSIAVGGNEGHINLGWFIGYGKNSLLYYPIWGPSYAAQLISAGKKPKEIKSIMKDYIISIYPGRVIKITDPESAFWKSEQHQWYKDGVELLTELNFLNK
jgi:hypothetical protein